MTMDWTQIALAFIALLSATAVIGGPIYSARSIRRELRLDKEQEYKRLDQVAEKAEAAAARNASLIAELNRTQAQTAEVIFGKMDVLHTLSNSTLTAAMQLSLDGMKRELILMERDPAINGGAIEGIKKKINEMDTVIGERNKQTGVADLQDQRAEALKAAQIVGVRSPPSATLTPKPGLGTVTERVLSEEPAPIVAAKELVAATETVDATAKAADAAVKTVEALEKKL